MDEEIITFPIRFHPISQELQEEAFEMAIETKDAASTTASIWLWPRRWAGGWSLPMQSFSSLCRVALCGIECSGWKT